MKVTVELISPLGVITGRTDPFTVELADSATGTELIRTLGEEVKELPLIHSAVLAGGLMLLVNQKYTIPETGLKEGDRVSVVLRVSGI